MEQNHRILVEGCLKGNSLKQKELYDTFAPAMYAVAMRYANNKLDADDMLQNAFINALQQSIDNDITIGSVEKKKKEKKTLLQKIFGKKDDDKDDKNSRKKDRDKKKKDKK